jgi:hypothetical protein
MADTGSFQYEVKKAAAPDSQGNAVTTITCHGRLVSENSGGMKDIVKPNFHTAAASLSISAT